MQNVLVDLMDGSGKFLQGNFVSVETSGSAADPPQWLELHASSMPNYRPQEFDPLYSSATGNADCPPTAGRASGTDGAGNPGGLGGSGLLMTACLGNGGTAQLPLGLADGVTQVGLRLNYEPGATGSEDVLVFLTYGNVMVGNTLKDNERPRGN